MLKEGIQNRKGAMVTDEVTAVRMGSGFLPVYATPAMILLIEDTCASMVQMLLEADESTVGISLDIKHIAPTPVGVKVCCDAELTKIEGKKLTFTVKVTDDRGLIGTGTHKRAIIKDEEFMAKARR